jgi:hypothetical protein
MIKHSLTKLLLAIFVAVVTLESARAEDCMVNTLPGHETFCLHEWDKSVKLIGQGCGSYLGPLHGDHLKFKCTSGRNVGKEWDVYCWDKGGLRCNVTPTALCTYDPKRMRGAQEWNPGQHCTEQIR